MLNILYDPYIVEEIVFLKLRGLESAGNLELYDEFHSLSDEIYELNDEDERFDRFVELNREFFNKLGFSEAVREVVDEFPELSEKIEEIHIRKVTSLVDMGSNLADEKRKTVIRVFPEQFMDIVYLKKFLRHEMMHVVDMLDEKFGYKDGKLSTLPAEETIMRDRYKLFWDIFIDNRLEKRGKETVQTKNERFREFERLYVRLPSEKKKAVFEGLWKEENLTHDKAVELARDNVKLVATYVVTSQEAVEETKKVLIPGGPCPLCNFPTHNWIEASSLDEQLIKLIRADFPDWQVGDGICDRCTECYTVRAGMWFKPKKITVS
ncbi:MAG TPA: hypothetical protein ACFYD6_09310 [Candidatus Brocadiia bacterium]|nr:hypothetical protein [Planctomycetota bacterium]MDO8094561.1 hypothetical protein [Candidatus Brocadiales bacterium]